MGDEVPVDSRQLDSLLKARGWSRGQLLEPLGIPADALERAEAHGAAPASLACALATALDVSPAMLDGGSPQARAARRKTWYWIVIGLGVVLLLSLAFGYRVGADLAKRENDRDCVVAGGVGCARR